MVGSKRSDQDSSVHQAEGLVQSQSASQASDLGKQGIRQRTDQQCQRHANTAQCICSRLSMLAVGITGIALLLREPVIRVMFQRGDFTAESTKLVSTVFLGLGPLLIGWSLLEITSRSLFALDRPWPPVFIALVPVLVNAALTLGLGLSRPQWIGAGASAGALAGFALLFLIVRLKRRRWMEAG